MNSAPAMLCRICNILQPEESMDYPEYALCSDKCNDVYTARLPTVRDYLQKHFTHPDLIYVYDLSCKEMIDLDSKLEGREIFLTEVYPHE